jgi:hypothetical protein
MKVAYFPEALEELEEAVRYYDGKRPGLGDEFFDEVQEGDWENQGTTQSLVASGKEHPRLSDSSVSLRHRLQNRQ